MPNNLVYNLQLLFLKKLSLCLTSLVKALLINESRCCRKPPSIKLVIPLLLFCLPCFATPTLTPITLDNDSHLKNRYGYVLLSININVDLKKIYVSGKKSFYLANEETKQGKRYIMLTLPEGEYRFSRMYFFAAKHVSRFFRTIRPRIYFDDENYFNFNVKSGKINYIGEIYIEKQWQMGTNRFAALGGSEYYTNLINNSTDALEFLTSKFPNLLSVRSIEYSGPGKDDFFQKVVINNKKGAQ